MLKRIGKGSQKVKRHEKKHMIAGRKKGARWGPVGKRDPLFSRFVVLDTDLIGDAGMGVREVVAFSVADDLS